MDKRVRKPISEIMANSSQGSGMKCPECGCIQIHEAAAIVSTRHTKSGKITRRRQCRSCGLLFTTTEIIKIKYKKNKKKIKK